MRILITTDLFTTATNGVATSVKNLWNGLKGRGHDVRILTLSENTKSYKDGEVYYIRSMPIGVVYPNARMPLSYRHKLIKELIDWKPDIIHSQCEFFTMQFATWIARKTHAPIVHTYHTMYEQYVGYVGISEKFGRSTVSFLTKKRLNKVSLVIAPTPKVKEVLKSYSLPKPIQVIPSGINLDQHKTRLDFEKRREMRNALGITDDKIALVNLGRLGTEKNVDELIAYFAKVAPTHENLVFLIVGDGPAREQLEKQAKELGVQDSVIFAGMVDPSQVQDYYQLGDIFVSASTSEAQGLTYVEAAANGLPLLCRHDACLENVIRQGENGYEYNNEKEFVAYLDAILDSDEWRLNAGKLSEEISASFDRAAFGESMEKAYTHLLKKRKQLLEKKQK